MRNGRLNKPELARIARAYRDLNAMQAELPQTARSPDEETTLHLLLDARNRLGELLRWQDFDGAWVAAQTPMKPTP